MAEIKPIKPIFKRWNQERQCWQWGLGPEDFFQVMAGYACGRCLEPFPHWLPACPLCGEPTVPDPAELPDEWRKQGE
jgi:predicted amidophosphoribosyltransferase